MAAVDGQLGLFGAGDHRVGLALQHGEQVVGDAVHALGRVVHDVELGRAVVVNGREDAVDRLRDLQQVTVARHHVVQHVRQLHLPRYASLAARRRTAVNGGELLGDHGPQVVLHLLLVAHPVVRLEPPLALLLALAVELYASRNVCAGTVQNAGAVRVDLDDGVGIQTLSRSDIATARRLHGEEGGQQALHAVERAVAAGRSQGHICRIEAGVRNQLLLLHVEVALRVKPRQGRDQASTDVFHLDHALHRQLAKHGMARLVGSRVLVLVHPVSALHHLPVGNLLFIAAIQRHQLAPHVVLLLLLRGAFIVVVKRGAVSVTMEHLHQSTAVRDLEQRGLQRVIGEPLAIVEADSVDTERKQLRRACKHRKPSEYPNSTGNSAICFSPFKMGLFFGTIRLCSFSAIRSIPSFPHHVIDFEER